MPCELHGAAATIQRLMDKELQPVTDCALDYIDDIIIFSKTCEEHIEHLTQVLQCLCQASLNANPKKCQTGKTRVRHLKSSL